MVDSASLSLKVTMKKGDNVGAKIEVAKEQLVKVAA